MKPTRFRIAAVAALALFFLAAFAARSLWPAWGSGAAALPDAKVDAFEPLPRREVEAARKTAEAALSQSGATAPQRAAAWGALGRVYLAYHLLRPAAVCLRKAGELDAQDFRWPYLLAHALEEQGQGAAATQTMRSAIDRMKSGGATQQARVAALCFIGESALRRNATADARLAYKAALEIAPRAPFPLVRLGQLESRAGNRAPAIGFYERALATLHDLPEILDLIAAEQGRPHNPVPDPPFAYVDPEIAALRQLDHSSAGFVRLGSESEARGRRQEAIATYRQAVEQNPASVPARAHLGRALLAAGSVDEGRRELEEAVRLDPSNRPSRAALALSYARSESTREKGVAMAEALRTEQPGRRDALQNLAAVYAAAGRYADALALYRDAASQAPAELWPRLGEARSLAALGRYPAARTALESAVQALPENPAARLALARLLVTAPDAAVRDPARSLRIARELLSAGFTPQRAETVALALAENRRYPEAAETQRRAIAKAGDEAPPRMQEILLAIEARRPWRETWPFRSGPEE